VILHCVAVPHLRLTVSYFFLFKPFFLLALNKAQAGGINIVVGVMLQKEQFFLICIDFFMSAL